MEDLRVIKTRENIFNTFINCLKDHPFKDISVKMIVEKARINRSTFYRNYEDKYILLDDIIDYQLRSFTSSADCGFILMHYSKASEYHKNLYKLVNYIYTNKDVLLVLWDASLPYNLYQNMCNILSTQLLEIMKNEYRIKEEKFPLATLHAQLFAAITMETLRWWIKEQPELSYEQIIKIMANNAEKGLFLSIEEEYKS